ncbi:energy transducer TonB [Halopseudomonas xiamenensis]|uniref:energy transducer TonB n=1 Tax=Halopseudomonas xiamenensis TaxID=157792 RepID=UPI00162A3E07|nr:energy transducer TonB [Halopseudomonas xiamenensis]
MRLLVSFAGGLLVTLALFALMIALVMPPRDNRDLGEELARVSFVRSVSDSSSDSRQRQQREAPERPQPPEVPTPQQPQQPQVSTNVQLNIAVPNLPTPGISVAVTPSMSGLTAAEVPAVAAPAPAASAPAPAASGPSTAEEVSPLVDIPPNYPQRALAAGIEGEVTLAFTITPDGRVENLRVTHAQPKGVFEREARRAASRWRFAPRRENGQPVAREATKTLYFRLEGR